MNPYALGAAAIGGVLLAVVLTLGGYKAGAAVTQAKWNAADLKRAETVIRVQEQVIKEVPVIVTKYVTQKVTVEKEVPRVVEIFRRDVAPDCVLPAKFAGLLVDFARTANGLADGASRADETYGCADTLEALVTDLAAGYENTAKGSAIQRFTAIGRAPPVAP